MIERFSGKAGTLDGLTGRLVSARIAPIVRVGVADWRASRAACAARVKSGLPKPPWIVRSSASSEDRPGGSNAGAFLSVKNVAPANFEAAAEAVIESYGRTVAGDEFFVQPMLTDVVRSGVVFSHDPNTRAPYRVVNWSEGANTATVTGGMGGRIWQCAALSPVEPPDVFAGPIRLVEELLGVFGGAPIDCEFAVTNSPEGEILWLLQVRPLAFLEPPEPDEVQAARLELIHLSISRAMQRHPFLMGARSVFGVMPDWNPAEIIGIRPRPLALSMYRELITDSIWAYQRHNYGYRNLRSFPLMPHFFGLPYIDVRLSFNSFIPAELDDGLAARLVDYYITKLLSEPELHDKVEFEIVFSCYTLDLPSRLERLKDAGFGDGDCAKIIESLRRLTNRIVHPRDGLWRGDAAKLDTLSKRRDALAASGSDLLDRIHWLVEDAKRYGTLPFAGLARAGFVAVQLLRSLVSVEVLSESNYDEFLESISTVSGQLARDRAILDRTSFLARYGHLRPGTYDILSPRYDEAPDLYFDWSHRPPTPPPNKKFSVTMPQMRKLATMLDLHGLEIDPVGLIDFLQAGIELRESSKFEFTRNLSDALRLIGEFGASLGFSLDDISYSDFGTFREMHTAAVDRRDLLANSIEIGRRRHEQTCRTSLPPLIVCPDDVWQFQLPETSPNFITQRRVTAPVVNGLAKDALPGAIVCIPSADPGYDWLFSYPIAGLVTAWGGANSHMAIRAGELGLPSVVGVGEVRFARYSNAARLHIDCAGRRVEILE